MADQFGEQVVLCGGVIELLQAAFDALTGRGYDPVNAYFECVHELSLISDLLQRHGLEGMRRRISSTAAYGGLTRGRRVVGPDARDRLAAILDEIEDGTFAREFLSRHDDPARGTAALAAAEASTALARMGRRLREASVSPEQAVAPRRSSGASGVRPPEREREKAHPPMPAPPEEDQR